VIALLAVWSIGGVATTVNPLATADELARQLTDAGACMLLTAPELMSKALSLDSSRLVAERGWPVR
jgi:acyl-CoA synthetase (AMP-forming)/AMP-acid ligase II